MSPWQCPFCKTVYSPYIMQCNCQKNNGGITSGSTGMFTVPPVSVSSPLTIKPDAKLGSAAQALLSSIVQRIVEAKEKGETSLKVTDSLPGVVIMKLTQLGYRIETLPMNAGLVSTDTEKIILWS